MIKKLSISLIGIFCLFLGFNKVSALGSITVNKTSMYLGDSVTVTVTISQAAAWQAHVNVSGAASNSNCDILSWADSDANAQNTSKTYTATCRPTKTGTINFILSGDTTDAGGSNISLSGTQSVIVTNRPAVQQPTPSTPTTTVTPKSSVNYLSSLEIEGESLTPKFDKETLDYTIELKAGTTSINIKATAQDSKATITGLGKKNVSEGINNFSIVVTAENGSKRTYTIKVNVKENNPVIVKVNNEEFTVIRKREQLIEASAFYSETTVQINGENIPAYYGEVTGYILVGLKNSEGIINLYIYDEDNNSYKSYHEFDFARIVFYPIEIDDENILKNYFKSTIIIDDMLLTCYKMNETDEFVLLYGVNIENNHTGFYIYDPFENTLQRYNDKIFDKTDEEIAFLKSVIIGLFGIIIIVVIAAAIQGTTSKIMNKNNSNLGSKKDKKERKTSKEKKKEEKLLKKEAKRQEKLSNEKNNKIDDTTIIDVNDINIKK